MNTLKLLTALIAISLPLSSSAAAFMKIEGIDGESLDTTSAPIPVRIQEAPRPVVCTADAKICPDGTAVGRDANNNCEFFPCPVSVKLVPTPGALPELPPFNPCIDGFVECPDGSCVRDREECFVEEPTALPTALPIKTNGTDIPPKQIDPPSLLLDSGPSDTEAAGGNAETEWKVEKGEKALPDDSHKDWINLDSVSNQADPDRPIITGDVPNPEAKKPKEILVVGSKGKKEIEVEREARIEKATAVLQQQLTSADQLPVFVQALADTDDHIEEVRITSEVVSMSYVQPAKLFGFIPVQYTMTTAVEVRGWDFANKEAVKGKQDDPEDVGRIKVKLPWWSIFTTNNADDIAADMQEILDNTDNDPLQKMQQTLQTMSNVSKMHHDTAMSIIRKTN